MLVSSIDYNDYVGRIGIGRIERGILKQNQDVMISNFHDKERTPHRTKIVNITQFDGLRKTPAAEAKMGDIIAFSGADDITIGDTITSLTV